MEWQELGKRSGESLGRFVAVRAVLGIARNLIAANEVPDLKKLTLVMKTPEPVLSSVLESLVEAKILARVAAGHAPRSSLAGDPAQITLAQLLLVLRGEIVFPKKLFSGDTFGQEGVLQEIDSSLAEGRARLSLRDAVSLLDKHPGSYQKSIHRSRT